MAEPPERHGRDSTPPSLLRLIAGVAALVVFAGIAVWAFVLLFSASGEGSEPVCTDDGRRVLQLVFGTTGLGVLVASGVGLTRLALRGALAKHLVWTLGAAITLTPIWVWALGRC
jgi:hypothetical protein